TKLHAERIEVLKPANELVVLAVTKLEEYSKPLRIEGESPYLFLNRQRNKKGYPVGQVSHSNWNKNYVRPWLREHNFVDEEGNLIDFTSQTYKPACETNELKGGDTIEVISELINHKAIKRTTH